MAALSSDYPEHVVALMDKYPTLKVLRPNNQVRGLHTFIRDRNTKRADFVFYSDRLIRLLIEEGLNYLPFNQVDITTPTGDVYNGVEFASKICGVSIVRAGESMETGLRAVCKSVRIGKILIQRDERTAQPKLYYAKFPDDIKDRKVLLLDPMLATGGSAIRAVEVLKENGVPEANILFINLIAAPEGIHALLDKFPEMQVITTEVDARLDDRKFILPGVGDFGDRYFGTAEGN